LPVLAQDRDPADSRASFRHREALGTRFKVDSELVDIANAVAQKLMARKETIAVAESSAGGLISAALLSVPGASAYYLGGGVIYTRRAFKGLFQLDREAVGDLQSSTEPYAAFLAKTIREKLRADWGVSETGAAGPSGNIYGDPAGHSCVGVAGPLSQTRKILTGYADRAANMTAFAVASLTLLRDALDA